MQVDKEKSNPSRTIATRTKPMIVRDDIIESASEAAVLRFVLALFDLEHEKENVPAEVEAVSLLPMSKNAFIQHRDGKGSIGHLNWMKLSRRFDIRPYLMWVRARESEFLGSKGQQQ